MSISISIWTKQNQRSLCFVNRSENLIGYTKELTQNFGICFEFLTSIVFEIYGTQKWIFVNKKFVSLNKTHNCYAEFLALRIWFIAIHHGAKIRLRKAHFSYLRFWDINSQKTLWPNGLVRPVHLLNVKSDLEISLKMNFIFFLDFIYESFRVVWFSSRALYMHDR